MSKFPPNIDGLSFDETLLALVPGIAAVIIARRLSKRAGRGGPHPGIAPSAPADEATAQRSEKWPSVCSRAQQRRGIDAAACPCIST